MRGLQVSKVFSTTKVDVSAQNFFGGVHELRELLCPVLNSSTCRERKEVWLCASGGAHLEARFVVCAPGTYKKQCLDFYNTSSEGVLYVRRCCQQHLGSSDLFDALRRVTKVDFTGGKCQTHWSVFPDGPARTIPRGLTETTLEITVGCTCTFPHFQLHCANLTHQTCTRVNLHVPTIKTAQNHAVRFELHETNKCSELSPQSFGCAGQTEKDGENGQSQRHRLCVHVVDASEPAATKCINTFGFHTIYSYTT